MSAEVLCCQELEDQLETTCEDHDDPYECPDVVVIRAQAGWIGIPIHDGGASAVWIDYCPWCGSKLPSSAEFLPDEVG